MQVVRTLGGALRVIAHLLTGAGIADAVAGHLGGRPRWVPAVVRWWCSRLCRALGLRISVTGGLADNALLVANHVSWLDVPVLGAQGEIGFLSKAEVRGWPLIGWMAETAGTLFIERGGNQANELVEQIGERIRRDGRVAIFPEGMTSDGRTINRFHARLFAAAAQPRVWIQPVALRYGRQGDPDRVAPFVGEDDLVSHLLRLLRHPQLEAGLMLLPPFQAGDLDRRRIAGRCRSMIADALELGPASRIPSALGLVQSVDSALAPSTPVGETS